VNRAFQRKRCSRFAVGQTVSFSRTTPRAIWVTRGDCPPRTPCTASFPTSRSLFSGRRVKTGARNRSAWLGVRSPQLVNHTLLQYASHGSALRSCWVVRTPKHTVLGGVFKSQTTCGQSPNV
jgi:hypothetical protein